MSSKTLGLFVLLVLVGLAGLVLKPSPISAAQTGQTLWTQPVNVSRSGGASLPALAAEPDGTLHLLWWDAVDGEQYARTTSITGTLWTRPAPVTQIVGRRKLDPQTNKIVLTAPRDARMAS